MSAQGDYELLREREHEADLLRAELLDAAEAAEAKQPQSQPVISCPTAENIETLLVSASQAARRVFPTDDAGRLAFECGMLASSLRCIADQFREVEADLLRELQLALNETCNSYHDAGHAARVEKRYGLVAQEEA